MTSPVGPLRDFGEDYGDTQCPPDVNPADCVPMTAAERQLLIDDLQLHVRWDEPDCAQIGYIMEDFAWNGDMRTFPQYSTFWGWWQHANYQFPGQPEQISFEQSQLQGWSSQRIITTIHEGVHSFYQQGNEAHAYTDWYENYCINW